MKQVVDESRNIKVVFYKELPESELLRDSVIYISPGLDKWNDFGYRTKVKILIYLKGQGDVRVDGYIGFITNSPKDLNGVDRLNELLEGGSAVVSPAAMGHDFFTMLPDMESYRRLSREFGVDNAVLILRSINDLVVLGEFKTQANWLALACGSDVFLKSFMRNTESFFAFNNAGSILRGQAYERFRNMSNSLSITFQLAGKLNPHEMLFRFGHDEELPKRIAVVIGENGVGKSQTLGRIVYSAITGSLDLKDADTHQRPTFNRILAFAPTNETGSVFPSDRRKRSRVWYKRFALNRAGASQRARGRVSDSIIQVLRSEEYLGDFSRWNLFLESLEAINRRQEICLQYKDEVGGFVALEELSVNGDERALNIYASIDSRKDPVRVIDGVGYPLSSGEISFLRFAAQASLYVENGSLLLLDEPETHLHPSFISKFVDLLDRLLELTGSAAVIATHSVYFVREVFPEQVSVLRVNSEGRVETPVTALQTFGADVGAISYFVFNEDKPSNLALKVERRLLEIYDQWEELYDDYKDKLSLEVLSSLRRALETKTNE
ncbi:MULTISPECIES: AAA family ATPase [Pseudomonas]|jgi:ABC-type branched-subunit amino acid transport system ATPase component|uniref:AAA family ATPase n=1 Tax=Pseudomonas TaxID=286 RepID=UPI00102274B6|nr:MULTISPECIES: AAA family ATPase [Pseudomonas]